MNSNIHIVWALLMSVCIASCTGQSETTIFRKSDVDTKAKQEDSTKLKQKTQPNFDVTFPQLAPPRISNFVRRIFQDSKGNLWFGTNGDGVIRYNGEDLEYFSIVEGFNGLAVRAIVEDGEGAIWFGTERGLTKYKDGVFTNFSKQQGLIDNNVWSVIIDRKGIMWIGTLQGVCSFDGKVFTPFDLPETKPDHTRGVTSSKIVHSILEDSKSKMWFSTNGGVYIYDPITKKLSNISEKDGLCHNTVNDILEDKNGNFWFATHHNGICYWDGTSFTHLTKDKGVSNVEAWSLYEDASGNIWFPIEQEGVYRYTPAEDQLTLFSEKEGLASKAIQCIFEDKQGRIWFGGWMGLFRYDSSTQKKDKKSVFPVLEDGPWQ